MSGKGVCFRWTVASVAWVVCITVWGNPVESQEKYPTKSIEIVVPYPPGAGNDLAARLTADYLKRIWAVPVTVVNKPGGFTIPGALDVFLAAPDGRTIFQESIATRAVVMATGQKIPDLLT